MTIEELKEYACDHLCRFPSEYKDPDYLIRERCDHCKLAEGLDDLEEQPPKPPKLDDPPFTLEQERALHEIAKSFLMVNRQSARRKRYAEKKRKPKESES